MRTNRGTRIIQSLPSDTAWPELDELSARYRELIKEERVRNERIRTLEEQREGAIRRDTQAMAAQLRQGKTAKPDSSAVEKVEKEIGETRRELEAYDLAIDECEAELVDLVEAHKQEWLEEVEGRLAASRGIYRETIDKLDGARWSVAGVLALRRFLNGFPEDGTKSYLVLQSPLRDLRAPHGDPYHWDKVIAALHADTEDPEPPKEVVLGGGHAPYATLKGDPRGGLIHDEGIDLEDVALDAITGH